MFNAVNLAKGIIYRAALDYVEITKRQMKKQQSFRFTNGHYMNGERCNEELAELEEFFRGPLVGECLGLDGDEIIERLQARARKAISGATRQVPQGGSVEKEDLQRILDGQGGRMSADKFLELCRSRGVKVIASANGEAEEIKCAADWVDVIERERKRQRLKKATMAAYIGLQSAHYCNMLSRHAANAARLGEYCTALGIRVELAREGETDNERGRSCQGGGEDEADGGQAEAADLRPVREAGGAGKGEPGERIHQLGHGPRAAAVRRVRP